jgi:hypothetical protein
LLYYCPSWAHAAHTFRSNTSFLQLAGDIDADLAERTKARQEAAQCDDNNSSSDKSGINDLGNTGAKHVESFEVSSDGEQYDVYDNNHQVAADVTSDDICYCVLMFSDNACTVAVTTDSRH